MRRLLVERVAHIGELVKKGAFGEVWVPAFQAKDLATGARRAGRRLLPADQRLPARSALERLVRAAWALDAAGDTGNRSDVEEAYRGLADAARELERLFSALPAVAGAGR